MTTMRRDPLVDDYLRRLEAAAGDLPRERRKELVAEIEEHVEAALAESGDDKPAVRDVLERLGSPEEIAALIVLSVSFVLPGAGYLIGAGLVLASKAWTGREQAIGLLLSPFVVLAGAIVVLVGASSAASGDSFDSGLGPLEIAVLAVVFLSGLVAAAYLSSRLKRP